ncbi:hypothetical protein LEP1GSC060_2682 [Leptospira weilii serovar Ranarum str. ICFT]|uniref:Uncharacterized protein n=1 Tax=Leptospira weilii serovar Ranarum str. ICFT TaxID=1218598 RepID=N1WL16_9LEPT|nr:hypothetical protein LEP1GSC060_2682 [Leptospira weilii serovar Ranarum str. ICFT]
MFLFPNTIERELKGVSIMKVMKSIFILLAVLGLNLSVLAQQNNQGGN